VGGIAKAEQQRALIEAYWEELQGDAQSQWQQFKDKAENVGQALNAAKESTHSYIDLAEQLRFGEVADESGLVGKAERAITLLPAPVEAVPVAIARLSNAVDLTSRYVMPFLAATPIGPAAAGAFKVLDVSFKAAAWFATSPLFQGRDRATVNPRLVPVAKAALADWKSPRSGRVVQGAMHLTALGEVFVARETVTDPVTGMVGQVIGIRKSGAIADEGTVRMYIVKLLEA
jgi:hypothetical protein